MPYTFSVKVSPEDQHVSTRVISLLHRPDVRGTLDVPEEEAGSG
ncbi:hypothetical protein [Burkholderia sp. SRS-W-2-2016]|nr:hypothetical protein [Burkholderia sp. SRS-W-2-2016]